MTGEDIVKDVLAHFAEIDHLAARQSTIGAVTSEDMDDFVTVLAHAIDNELAIHDAVAVDACAEACCSAWWSTFGGAEDPDAVWAETTPNGRDQWRYIAIITTQAARS